MAEQRTFIDALTHDDRDSSYIVAWSDGASWNQRAYRAGSITLDGIPEGCSVYMTRNGFTGKKRDLASCRQVNALMFDIDCHTPTFAQDVPAVLASLIDAIGTKIPEPTMIVDTGRGVQVYFVLARSISSKTATGQANERALSYFKDVEHALSATIGNIVSHIPGATLDTSVQDFARVGRVPGTYNPKARKWCYIVSAAGGRYTLDELKKYGTDAAFSHTRRANATRSKKRSGMLSLRLGGIERLQRHRGYDCRGSRENMCFVYYNTATQLYGPAKALDITHDFNARFNTPLPSTDIEQIARTVDNTTVLYGAHAGEKGFYPLRAASVIEKLFMTASEMQATRFFGTRRQEQRSAQRRKTAAARDARNARIVEKFRMGKTQDAIAAEVGCSKRTVAGVLKAQGVTRANRYTLEEKFNQVIASKQESADSRHSSWLCVGLTPSDSQDIPYRYPPLSLSTFGEASPTLFSPLLNPSIRVPAKENASRFQEASVPKPYVGDGATRCRDQVVR